jgi:hypothetical protein
MKKRKDAIRTAATEIVGALFFFFFLINFSDCLRRPMTASKMSSPPSYLPRLTAACTALSHLTLPRFLPMTRDLPSPASHQ